MEDGKKTKLALFDGIDCIHVRVANLENGLDFYQNALGLKLLWRTENACGLGINTGNTELVISGEDYIMVDIKVIEKFLAAEGRRYPKYEEKCLMEQLLDGYRLKLSDLSLLQAVGNSEQP